MSSISQASHGRIATMAAKALMLVYTFSLVPQVVLGHGFVQKVTINGQDYGGFDEPDWSKSQGSPVLVTDYLLPSYDVTTSNVTCGINPQAAQAIATVSPNDQIWWNWVTHSGSGYKSWTHNEGTHRSFIGPCIGDCGSTDPTQVEWTELPSQYTGQQTWDGNSWPVVTLANGNPWADSVPPAPNGDYLIRNELTALHYSTSPFNNWDASVQHGWGTEFYVTCMAIRIQGSGGSFDMSTAVKFPGAYTVNEAGHYNPNLWTDPNSVGIAALNTFPRSSSSSSNNNSGNTSSDSGSNPNSGNNGNSSGGNNSTPSSSANAATSTISNPVCNRQRRKRSLSSALGRRHQPRPQPHHRRQARRLTGH